MVNDPTIELKSLKAGQTFSFATLNVLNVRHTMSIADTFHKLLILEHLPVGFFLSSNLHKSTLSVAQPQTTEMQNRPIRLGVYFCDSISSGAPRTITAKAPVFPDGNICKSSSFSRFPKYFHHRSVSHFQVGDKLKVIIGRLAATAHFTANYFAFWYN